jgi:predicted dehydrogenase
VHRENVAFWHMAHSFVRGNWRNLAESSPMILAKCCHDMDLLYWNLNQPVRRLQSFGGLRHFRPENAPEGALLRCTDGCQVDCQYDARKIYLNMDNGGWPVNALGGDLSLAGRQKALETGWYGRCVYHCDNDVVDNQTVNMDFADGTTVMMTMHGHSYEEGRTMRYDGTRATLRGRFVYGKERIEIHEHGTGRIEEIPIGLGQGGHGGGDSGIVASFIRALNGDTSGTTTARESLESHLMSFAAEQSRLDGTVIDMDAYRLAAESLT